MTLVLRMELRILHFWLRQSKEKKVKVRGEPAELQRSFAMLPSLSTPINTEIESLRYLAGYLAWKIKKEGKGVYGLYSSSSSFFGMQSSTWINVMSNGGLLIPNDEIYSTVLNCEQVFTAVVDQYWTQVGITSILKECIMAHFPESKEIIVEEFVKIRI